MRIALWFLPLILLVNLNQTAELEVPRITGLAQKATKPTKETSFDAASKGDVSTIQTLLEAQEVARRFAKRLQETRYFNTAIEEVFVERFVDCHLRTMMERKESGIFSQEGLSVPPEVANQARSEELQRYLLARLNFFHLKTLHRISTRDLERRFDDSFHTAEQEYPPGAYDLLMKNPLIAGAAEGEGKGKVNISIKSIGHLRSLLPTLEQAVSMMRQHFMAHPPEEAELYRKNMSRIGAKPYDSKFWEIHPIELSEKDAEGGSRCFGLPLRLLTVIKVPPFYQLFIVQAGGQFRIATLLCTEPPCVD